MQLSSLVAHHEVDVMFVLPSDAGTVVPLPPGLEPHDAVVVPVARLGAVQALARWPFSRWPWTLMKVQWGAARPQVEARLLAGNYDVVWATDSSIWPALPESIAAPIVLDLDDLQDRKLEYRHEARRRYGPLSRRDRLFAIMDRIDLRRFRRLQADIVARARVVTVCSDLDADRLGVANVEVVPNGYRAPAITPRANNSTPTVLYLGDLTYRPNVEAAELLVKHVLPIIRRSIPAVQVRLVGDYGNDVAPLGAEPGVTLAGRVPDVAPELARADVALVPMLSGGGTRIKILESFAYGVPVVSTTVGAEGIDVENGVHLLLADTPEGLAEACVRVLSDPELAGALAHRARRRYEERYTPDAISRAVDRTVRRARGYSPD